MSERSKSKIQGEGDYEGARRYRRGVENYVKTADIDRAAREAEPDDANEARELEKAEEIGKSHAKDKGQSKDTGQSKDRDQSKSRGPR